MREKTLCITGGHQTPAIAVIEEIRKMHPTWNSIWIGRKYAFDKSKTISPEYTLVRSLDIPFESITTARLDRSHGILGLLSLLKLPMGLWQSMQILKKTHPDVIISFGGYIAFPVAVAAFFLNIPVIIHEQTHDLGLSNRLIASFAKKVCVTYPETLGKISKSKGVLTGLPIRQGIFLPPKTPSFPTTKENIPMVYITGGSTGAQSLNEKFFPIIAELVKDMRVIHQTGELSFLKAQTVKKQLREKADRYIIAPFFGVEDIAWIYAHTDIVAGRSGANTVAEVSAYDLHAIFIPLPWAGENEQMINAQAYQKTGKAIIIQQDDLTGISFFDAMKIVLKNKNAQKNRVLQHDGAENMVREVDTLLSSYDRN